MEIACIIHEQISHFFVPKNKFLLAHFVPQINSVIMQPNPLENWTQNLTPQFTKNSFSNKHLRGTPLIRIK